ncbi:sensor histidine kinase [Desulfobacca acetoxidans]|uniref:histidine kinase n=1 Tax=Desulfobacca acetoxidans (strain ATCC 700848 / DSM 11109 / ASRB2) TaxID=880072 RepID=F2NHV4_DESAR|nr:PAS domain-containing sensor histidine kinase [Desulfobacca acetoxidans]AEB09439.1 PAS/PAC sensor signal transduction histidine kinase [Desulfobacca acetoxidans DSM 11109]HAY23241.1 PAS domain-containing sensor histidine kinase [Desulfobacterales bacterium]
MEKKLLPLGLSDWSHFIIQSIADGVITVNGEMRITDLNRAGEKITGYSRAEALGKYCGDILRSSMCGRDCPLKQAMISGEAVSREAVLHNRLDQKIEVMLTASALRDDHGNLLGGVETFRDNAPFKLMEKERRQLAGMFAHDLKGPVVGVAGLLNRLRQGKVGELNEQQQAFLETIYQEILRLEKLISNFLDFVRLDLHILKPLASAIQVEAECLAVINRSRPMAEAKGVDLQLAFPQEVIILNADAVLLQRALGNLVENAIKYSPPQSQVILKVQDLGKEIQFVVQDQGPGIDPDDLPHLFDLLYRGKDSGQESGLGLGLAIVKRIIEAHNGRLWVKSELGQGASFFFNLPKANFV